MYCSAGFQLVLQACLALFLIYTLLTFDQKKRKKKEKAVGER
jgi:hypothetical protein